MQVRTYEATVENGSIRLPDEVRLPEKTRVYVVVPNVEPAVASLLSSSHLAHPGQSAAFAKAVGNGAPLPPLVEEFLGEHLHRYYPLGEYVVVQPGVCGSRPTIKHTRIDARWIIGLWESGTASADIARGYNIALEAVLEAIALRDRYDYEQSYA